MVSFFIGETHVTEAAHKEVGFYLEGIRRRVSVDVDFCRSNRVGIVQS